MSDRAKDDFCGALLVGEVTSGKPGAALVRGAKWNPGDRIEVCFLDGVPSVQEKVKTFAKEWTAAGLANLRFVFRRKPAGTAIRISFKYQGNYGPWATCNVELDPGVYRLSVETPHGTLSQTSLLARVEKRLWGFGPALVWQEPARGRRR